MPIELTPALTLLDRITTLHVANDSNIYQAGRIGDHHVVMVTLDRIGLGGIPSVATSMYASFRDLKHLFLVGIGGGIPYYSLGEQIVYGDVVVSRQVEHLDCGRRTPNGFEYTNQTYYPNSALLKAANTLSSTHNLFPTRIPHILQEIRQKLHGARRQDFEDLGPEADRLFDPEYNHDDGYKICDDCCDPKKSRLRMERGRKAHRERDSPYIHFGTIGSGNSLVVGSKERERLYKQFGAICFEMEAAALLQYNPLVIRGICDYSDSHKNKKWQAYAAATAAAYAQELILRLPAHTHGVNYDEYPAPNMDQGIPSASEDWVPAPSSTQKIENVHQVAELEVPDKQDTQEPYSFPEPSETSRTLVNFPAPSSTQKIEIMHQVAELEVPDKQDTQEPYSFPEPSGAGRTLMNFPMSLYDRCQSWIERTSTPFFNVIIASKPLDPLLYEIQCSLASRFMSMTLDEGLPLLAFRCSRSVYVSLDFMLQALCRQLYLYLSRENPEMKIPGNQYPNDFEAFQELLGCINRNVSGVFQNLENISASGDQIQRFRNILASHCVRYPLSKFLFLTRGLDNRLILDERDVHLLRDRTCNQPLRYLKYS
ncbi:MAG: hypothetical protein L6R38_009320 [Xanthoria sp. 2 TBL-2021]|nr:MAG: hypothetical protein L6R38_009320 [Xanthoria sp. 2 TBL-2021]